jgi:xylulose-5-phosphate/fructose-6-phosphate phosphoketolase
LSSPATNKDHLVLLEEWLKSYEPETLFDEQGRLLPELQELVPERRLRMGTNPFTNPHVKPLVLPAVADYAVPVDVSARGKIKESDTYVTGTFLRDVIRKNEVNKNFRMFGPDDTASNRLHAVFEATSKQWMGEYLDTDDETLAQYGRVMEMLSEHQCEGWLEGYLLTGGHGLLNSDEAFINIISSMFSQHAHWLKMCNEIEWRNKLSSLNILLASHVWRQDHNGFTHQDPGFLQHVATKKPDIVRIYLPPDANCLLSCMHQCLVSKHYVNVMVAGKDPAPQWLTIDEAHRHCTTGIGIWEWASNDKGYEPDLVLACAGDVPTLEALAAVSILREKVNIKVRFVNVVDLMRLTSINEHPHGLSDEEFDSIFTKDSPVLFNFHAYPDLVHKLIFGRTNRNFVVRGYKEEGTISTAFDMCVMNGVDRFHLVQDACNMIENQCTNVDEDAKWSASYLRQEMKQMLVKNKHFITENGVDMPEIENWEWSK